MTKAFVTLLYTASYLPGALVLGRALKELGLPTNTELVVLLATGLTTYEQSLLEEVYDVILEISLIHAQNTPQLTLLGRPELKPTFSKANLFALTQYEQVVYLDSDTLPLKRLDELLDIELRADQIAGSPDSGWPDIFNSGVLVIKPDMDVYVQLLERSQEKDCSFDGADQGLLNQFFNVGKPDGWVRLPFLFNVTPSGQYQYDPAYAFFGDEVRIVHFIGSSKPWTNPSNLGGLRDKWWEKYSEFYGPDKDVKKTIHGIDPRYYLSQPVTLSDEEKQVLPEPVAVSERFTEPVDADDDSSESNHQEEHIEDQYEQEFLLNPESYQKFETVLMDENQWNPAYEEPPKDGRPEAASFPSDLHFHNQWDDNAEGDQEEPDYQSVEPQTEPAPQWVAPSVFPWEVEERRVEPERVFDSAGSYSFDDTWENLPLIQKIRQLRIEADQKKDEKDLEETERDEDELKRLGEIEDRYTGTIEEQEVVVEKFEEEEEGLIETPDDGHENEEAGTADAQSFTLLQSQEIEELIEEIEN